MVVIEAAAGLGKTRLLEAALAKAAVRDMMALSARATELEREFAFGVIRQLIEPRLAMATDEQREALFEGAASLSRPVFAAIPEAANAPAEPAYAALHGLYWLLANLATDRQLLLTVDDAQWADAASLRFLHFLMPRLAELPLALIVTLRAAEPGTERAELARLLASPEALVLSPGPLSHAAVSELVGDILSEAPDAEFAAACQTASAGNPFYLQALLRQLRAQGLEPRAAHAEAVTHFGPPAIARAVLLRLAALDAEAPALARALAVLGDGAGLRETAALAGIEEERAGALDRERVDRVGLAKRPCALPRAGHQLRRHAHDPLATVEQEALKTAAHARTSSSAQTRFASIAWAQASSSPYPPLAR